MLTPVLGCFSHQRSRIPRVLLVTLATGRYRSLYRGRLVNGTMELPEADSPGALAKDASAGWGKVLARSSLRAFRCNPSRGMLDQR